MVNLRIHVLFQISQLQFGLLCVHPPPRWLYRGRIFPGNPEPWAKPPWRFSGEAGAHLSPVLTVALCHTEACVSPEGPGGRCCPSGLPFFISRSIARSLPGLSVESPQLPSTRKTPPSLSPLGPAEQGSTPLLSPVLSDAGGAGMDDQEEPRHKVGGPGVLAAGGLGSRGWGFPSPETLPPPPGRSGSLCA